jgi:hypothetical protein
MSEILQFKDAVDVITSILVNAIKIRFQAGKFSLDKMLIGTTTNIAKIRKYTKQLLIEPLFKVATKNIARSSASCVGISLQKA